MSFSLRSNQSAPIVVFDIDGVIRDVGGSYRRALADTVEHFTDGGYRPSAADIDALKTEGVWNNDWEASQELVRRYFIQQGQADRSLVDYPTLVAFFQARYRGENPDHWTGYICQEPLLVQVSYLEDLTHNGLRWGFFSGATRGSASYVLERRLGLQNPVLVAMEDAPGKPDPTGLFQTLACLNAEPTAPVIYVGDTVADMYTLDRAAKIDPDRCWIGVGVLPPHVQTAPTDAIPEDKSAQQDYTDRLYAAGAKIVLTNVQELTAEQIDQLY